MTTYKIPDHLDGAQDIMPAQWAALRENPYAISPEKRLWLAVIEDALRLITHKPPPRPPTGHSPTGQSVMRPSAQTWWNNYGWLIDVRSRHPGSLLWICDVLSGKHDDPFAMAKRIADKVKASQGFEVASRRPVGTPRAIAAPWIRRKRGRPSLSA